MQLTRLEIKGFKSFGDKVTIHFGEGVTGIVGQNGCGKSNIVDAIRWVLGEQKTRALRSDKMENIIFNGTKKRKPLQMAEVSLTFQNTKNLLPTEYTEVTVTRRLYRSGESEYLLNGVPCRLKDITNLFMDTGIGPDSYAIIELKMVDEILNDKENSRRNLFEEAAGISKFKVRKKETLRKLNDTQQNLDRVEDLLFEIEKNLKSLERQAKKTKRYYELKEEYKQKSILLAQSKTAAQRAQLAQIEKDIEQEQDKLQAIATATASFEAEIEELKTKLLQQERLLASRQKALNEHVANIRQYESEKKLKAERLKFLHEKINTLEEQIHQDQSREEELIADLERIAKERRQTEEQLKSLNEQFETVTADYEQEKDKVAKFKEQIRDLQNQLKQKTEALRLLEKQIEIKQTQISSIKQAIERHWQNKQNQDEDLAELQEAIAEAKIAREETEEELKQKETEEQQHREQVHQLEQEIEELRESLRVHHRERDAKHHEAKLLQSLIDNLEGYPETIRFLRKSGQWQSKAPLLSEVVACSEEYKLAIERYLEPWLSYFVVEDPSEAGSAIRLLDEQKKGKASFFLKKGAFPPTQTFTFYGKGVPARDVIECEEPYRPLLQALLANVWIVDDMPEDPLPEGITLISRDGKQMRSAYVLSGGSVGSFEGKRIGKVKELQALQQQIAAIDKKIADEEARLQEKQEALRALKQLNYRELLQQLQRRLNAANEQYVSLRTRYEQKQQLLAQQEAQSHEMEEQRQMLQEEIEELQPDYERLKKEQEALNARLQALEEEERTQAGRFARLNDRYNTLKLQTTQMQSRLESLVQEYDFRHSYVETLRNRMKKNREELAQVQQEVLHFENDSQEKDDRLVEMYEEKERLEAAVNEAERDYYKQRGEIEELEKKIREAARQKELQNHLIQELQNRRNELKMTLLSAKERVSVEFSVDLDQLEPPQEAPDVQALEQEVSTLKQKLDGFGAINPMAMEAYQEMKERYDFIQGQRQDLLEAKQSLLDTIDEADRVARENFLATFEQIRLNFQKVFRSLFTEEDTCDLVLTDPENPLESPIEIIAKPKGKRPLTINQLSGGEKTLTATSLLFAIYLIKPAPFCIFDEVDAPLDDANIDKFTNIIREFSKESQFIIVTHNKRTMAATDVMYGVTMLPEDPGVSKLVAVDMREMTA
ncbi:chromosome segregation protein SMC [Thermonema rossianum]|uniref:chromosome segregation protein SMC n=1 Tax=Thermonema rossianum TaxID=55505 RepID=UPI00056E7BEF|nr:chromosome segregation protein SMC [Thermonema rossianum]